jgi:hypothetical protein
MACPAASSLASPRHASIRYRPSGTSIWKVAPTLIKDYTGNFRLALAVLAGFAMLAALIAWLLRDAGQHSKLANAPAARKKVGEVGAYEWSAMAHRLRTGRHVGTIDLFNWRGGHGGGRQTGIRSIDGTGPFIRRCDA